MSFDLAVQSRLGLQVRILVLDARERVHAYLDLRLGKALLSLLLLSYLRIDVVDADNQTRPFLFLDHGGFQLNMSWLAIHHEAIAQSEDAAVLDL